MRCDGDPLLSNNGRWTPRPVTYQLLNQVPTSGAVVGGIGPQD